MICCWTFLTNKKENNLKNLSLRSDPYNMKTNLQDDTKHGYNSWKKKRNSCKKFVAGTTSVKWLATDITYEIRKKSTCSAKICYLRSLLSQLSKTRGSTNCWKPRYSNYKSHIKYNEQICKMVHDFIGEGKVCIIYIL